MRNVRRIGLYPLSSTPIRTRPPALAASVAQALLADGLDLEVVLDRQQRQGLLYSEALRASGGLPPGEWRVC